MLQEDQEAIFNPECSKCEKPIGNFGIFQWSIEEKVTLTFCSDACYEAFKLLEKVKVH